MPAPTLLRNRMFFGPVLVGVAALLLIGELQFGQGADGKQSNPPSSTHLIGPFVHDNLTIFLIPGSEKPSAGKAFLTLQEALDRKLIVVRETGQVNELTVENVSANRDVFIQSGDIVKGGKQDRIIALDLIVPPKSGKIAVASFCVEHGRWTQRGQEAVHHFNSSTNLLASKGLKLAGGQLGGFGGFQGQNGGAALGQLVQPGNLGGHLGQQRLGQLGNLGGQLGLQGFGQLGNLGGQLGLQGQFGNLNGGQLGQLGNLGGQFGLQGGVWSEVENLQAKLRKNVGKDLRSKDSQSSLQLTLENSDLRKASEPYLKKLSTILKGQPNIRGFAFAINGQINSAEVYASSELFQKLWPKLLRAAAIEALAERPKVGPSSQVTVAQIDTFLAEAEQGTLVERDYTSRVKVLLRETQTSFFFETRDRAQGDAWVHRSYLTR